jgi:exonuclease III
MVPMRIFCLNANRSSVRLKTEMLAEEPEILLLQEWADHRTDRSNEAEAAFSEFTFVSATRYLLTTSKTPAEVLHSEERILITKHEEGIVVNPYSPAEKGKANREHLERLDSLISTLDDNPILIAGDFNMAPRPEDGWYGRNHSDFTTKRVRAAFVNMMDNHSLFDLGAHIRWEATFERMNKGKITSFRCDLALVREDDAQIWGLTYNHDFRRNKGMSDHSALNLELE